MLSDRTLLLDRTISFAQVSEIESVLTIGMLNFSDAVRYQCRASNDAGSASAFTDLRVRPGGKFLLSTPFSKNDYKNLTKYDYHE